MAKSWQREPALRVRLSTYNEAILSKRNVSIVKGGAVTHITDREMDRLAEEWVAFRAGPGDATLDGESEDGDGAKASTVGQTLRRPA